MNEYDNMSRRGFVPKFSDLKIIILGSVFKMIGINIGAFSLSSYENIRRSL